LLRKINEGQLTLGRVGLLLDLPKKGSADDTPIIALYRGGTIINWDNGAREELTEQQLNLVVLDESENVRGADLEWDIKNKYRLLSLGPVTENDATGVYSFQTLNQGDQVGEIGIVPNFRGTVLNEVPFVFINAVDLAPEPDVPPLLDLANLCLTIYRGSADYRQNLFMQGQDTLVIVGGDSEDGADGDGPIRVGAGSIISVPIGGNAKYEGVTANGLSEQRVCLENDEIRAGSMGAGTLDTTSRERESGTSLNTRISARTADLKTIAEAGAKGLENILRMAAVWVGANPDEVSVVPNKDFGDKGMDGQDAVNWTAARNQGAPLSARSMHEILVTKGITKLTFEEEMAEVEKERDGPFDPMRLNGDVNPQQDPNDGDPAKKATP
jgi:hypothetical protein